MNRRIRTMGRYEDKKIMPLTLAQQQEEKARMESPDEYVILDNGGETFDRYTLVTESGDIYGFSDNPFAPNGYGQFSSNFKEKEGGSLKDWVSGFMAENPQEKKLTLADLPETAQKFVNQSISTDDAFEEARDEEVDTIAADELTLYIENDGDLYRQMAQPIIKNMARKRKNGSYDAELAVKSWMNLADEGAKRYKKDFGDTFDRPTRLQVAKNLMEGYEEAVQDKLKELEGGSTKTESQTDRSYYANELKKVLPIDEYGVRFSVQGTSDKTKFMELNADSFAALADFIKQNISTTKTEAKQELIPFLREHQDVIEDGEYMSLRSFIRATGADIDEDDFGFGRDIGNILVGKNDEGEAYYSINGADTYLESTEDKKTFNVRGNHGVLICDVVSGEVLEYRGKEEGDEDSYDNIDRMDVEEWKTAYPNKDISNGFVDILDLGYWTSDGQYEEPAEDWRKKYNKQESRRSRMEAKRGNQIIDTLINGNISDFKAYANTPKRLAQLIGIAKEEYDEDVVAKIIRIASR